MASLSSIAAYLIKCFTWNEEAEAYPGFVVGAENAAVPPAFLIFLFEIIWMSLLLMFRLLV